MITFNNIFHEKYTIHNYPILSDWITQVIENEGYKCGDVVYICTSDEYLLEINRKYLQHDTYTDIITFPESNDSKIISGEIFISLDRVYENANKFEISQSIEFARIVVHGVLHLLGYNDKSAIERRFMREKEDYYINLQPNTFGKLFHVKHL